MSLPPQGLAGLDPAWSREVVAPDHTGTPRTWHLLDTHPDGRLADGSPVTGTLLCVHGNPTWSYLWRKLVAAPPAGWRVVAVDQLEMGYSQRSGTVRTLPDRVVDLTSLTTALPLTGPVVLVAHDWGGPIGLGWALGQVAAACGDISGCPPGAAPQPGTGVDLVGIILTNTGVHQPEQFPAPWPLRAATLPGMLPAVTSRTPGFITSALFISQPAPPREVRAGYHAPYPDAQSRAGIEAFVRDIPFDSAHPSSPELDRIAAGVATEFSDIPVLLAWGPRDPVFSEMFLADLLERLPHADVQRYPRSSHLVAEDAPTFAADAARWVSLLQGGAALPFRADTTEAGSGAGQPIRPIWADLADRAAGPDADARAVVELGPDGPADSISFAELHRRIELTAAGWQAAGLQPGDRVSLLLTPGIEFVVATFSVWRAGGVGVVVDAGLGLRGMRGALASARPQWVVGEAKGLTAARAMRLPARFVLAGEASAMSRAAHPDTTMAELARRGLGAPLPVEPNPEADALIAFTSGATGPAKGVAYRHAQLAGQREAIREAFQIEPNDALVAGFGPFALIAPALGIPTAIPDMDIMAPRTLGAAALADAVAAVAATMVFAAPAALANLEATAGEVLDSSAAATEQGSERVVALAGVRLLLSAGAPVPEPTLIALTSPQGLLPNAEAHTPYGMTECLPATDITLAQMRAAGPGNGVCVGWPVPGVEVRISALDHEGRAVGELSDQPGPTGEIVLRAPHVKARYDRLWVTQEASARPIGWHRTGDVGHLDDQGRLWVEGRMVHVVRTAAGPVTPVGLERAATDGDLPVSRAAAVGVGPAGAQVVVLVLEARALRPGLAPPHLRDAAREEVASRLPDAPDIAAVLVTRALPTDIRHNSKIDRPRVARWAAKVLAGGRAGRL